MKSLMIAGGLASLSIGAVATGVGSFTEYPFAEGIGIITACLGAVWALWGAYQKGIEREASNAKQLGEIATTSAKALEAHANSNVVLAKSLDASTAANQALTETFNKWSEWK